MLGGSKKRPRPQKSEEQSTPSTALFSNTSLEESGTCTPGGQSLAGYSNKAGSCNLVTLIESSRSTSRRSGGSGSGGSSPTHVSLSSDEGIRSKPLIKGSLKVGNIVGKAEGAHGSASTMASPKEEQQRSTSASQKVAQQQPHQLEESMMGKKNVAQDQEGLGKGASGTPSVSVSSSQMGMSTGDVEESLSASSGAGRGGAGVKEAKEAKKDQGAAAASAQSPPKEKEDRRRARRELPASKVRVLKDWLMSPEHINHPYPTASEQLELVEQTGLTRTQLKNW
ncbi:unnamed protein product [Chrysoparadoxa australica]